MGQKGSMGGECPEQGPRKKKRYKVGYNVSQYEEWEESTLNRALEKGKDASRVMV